MTLARSSGVTNSKVAASVESKASLNSSIGLDTAGKKEDLTS